MCTGIGDAGSCIYGQIPIRSRTPPSLLSPHRMSKTLSVVRLQYLASENVGHHIRFAFHIWYTFILNYFLFIRDPNLPKSYFRPQLWE